MKDKGWSKAIENWSRQRTRDAEKRVMENGKRKEFVMTTLLEKAFEKASQLPDVEQNALAKQLLEDLETEKQWDKKFAESEDILDILADEALEEHKQGKTRTLNLGELWTPKRQSVFGNAILYCLAISRRRQKKPTNCLLSIRIILDYISNGYIHPPQADPIFSLRVTKNYRAVGFLQNDEMIWFWIGSHSEYDKLLKQLRDVWKLL